MDADSYFFHNFMDIFIVQNRVIRLSKVSSEKLNQTKILFLIHILRIKNLTLRLNYTSQGKKIVYSRKFEIIKISYNIKTQICKNSQAKFFIPSFL